MTFNGEDVFDAHVYLFSESDSYLGRYERTDEYGYAEFIIPAESFKFRVDYDGTEYWSGVVNVIAHEETEVELPLEQLALNMINNPNPVRFDGKRRVFKPKEIRVAGIPPPEVHYYVNDHLRTPQLMTEENGTVVWEAK